MRTGRRTFGLSTRSSIAWQSIVMFRSVPKLILVAPTLGLEIKNERAVSSLTRGLVGDTSFAVLPEITSRITFIITLVAQLVSACRNP